MNLLEKEKKKNLRKVYWKKYSTKELLEKIKDELEKYKAENNESLISLYEWKIKTIEKYGGNRNAKEIRKRY